MTQEQFEAYQEQTFDSFCKTVIRNTARKILRDKGRRQSHEVSVTDMMDENFIKIATDDEYTLDAEIFAVRGESITIHDPALASALRCLPPMTRDVVLMLYFLEKTEAQIAQAMRITQPAVSMRHRKSLDQLKDILEATESDE